MISYSSVSSSVLTTEGRFNPKYLIFLEERNALLAKASSQIKLLGDKKYFPVLSDGIHTAVQLDKKGEIRYLYVHSLKEGFIDETDKIFLNESDHSANKSKELRDGDVLLSVVGTLGNAAMVSSYVQKPCSLPRNIAFIRPEQSLVSPSYLTCFFLSDFARNQSSFSGGGNVQGLLSLTKLKKLLIFLPPKPIQNEIGGLYDEAVTLQAKFLEGIFQAVNELEGILGISDYSRKKYLTYSVKSTDLLRETRWTPTLFYPMVDEAISAIGERFITHTLGDIAKISKGDEIGSDNYQDIFSKSNDAIPFARTSDVFNYEVDSYPDFWASSDIYEELDQDFHAGDVVVNNDGRIGFPAMLTDADKAIYQSHIRSLRSKMPKKFSNEYIFLCLLSPLLGEMQFRKYTVIQSTIPTLGNRLARFKIPEISKEDHDRLSIVIRDAYGLIARKKSIVKQIRSSINLMIHEAEQVNKQ